MALPVTPPSPGSDPDPGDKDDPPMAAPAPGSNEEPAATDDGLDELAEVSDLFDRARRNWGCSRCCPAKPQRYATFLADPPWDAHRDTPYPTMTPEQIAAMPVSDIAEDDAHLWLWVTNATLRVGYDIAEAWGFTVRSILTWVKMFRLGRGGYLRDATEHLLFATRGKAPVQFRSQPTWFAAPAGAHSSKPGEQYSIIRRVSGDERTLGGRALELFARRRHPGWDVWGNEVDSDLVIPGYPVPSDQLHEEDDDVA